MAAPDTSTTLAKLGYDGYRNTTLCNRFDNTYREWTTKTLAKRYGPLSISEEVFTQLLQDIRANGIHRTDEARHLAYHTLLRVIRELVINAIRHGNASSVKVAGTIDGDNLLCSVTDNGRGFDPETAPGVLQGHFGLQGIQERIEELGGEFTIRSSCGKGTKATINIPIPHES